MAEEENKIHGPTTETKAAYFIFGRFQPPHIGHAHLINILYSEAVKDGADPYVFPTSTQDGIKNPLSIERKVVYMKKMFPPRDYPGLRIINTTTQDCKTIYKVIGHLNEAGYTTLKLFIGQDRVESFTKQFNDPKIKEEFGTVGIFGVERPENGAETSASAAASAPIKMSATMVRGYATSGNNESFARATKIGNMTNANIESMISNVRAGLTGPKEKKEKKKKGSSASAAAGAPNNMEGGTRKRRRKYRNVPSRRRRHH
jgi:nicotinamide mononucleotide adenylyltransferase